MKRIGIALLTLVFALCLCACSGDGSLFEQEYKFPEGTSVLGVDIAGLGKEAAWTALKTATENYTLELTVDGLPLSIQGKDIGLSCSRDVFMAGADALEAGTEPDISKLIRYDDTKLRLVLGRNFNKPVVEAAIVYNASAGEYQLEPHADGLKTDHNSLAVSLRDVIRALMPQHTCTGFSEVLYPVWTADAPEAQTVLEQVNKMAGARLSYDFGTADAPMVHEIPAEVIRSFITLGDDGFQPAIDTAAVEAYVAELAAQYDTEPTTGPFPTTGGEVLDMVITYEGCYLDPAAMTHDIALCASLGYSGERTVFYLPGSVRGLPFGGTYVEVDLTNQHMWFYKEGELLTSSDLVSGNVAAYMMTPTGVFQIYSRAYGTTLEGPGYSSWVNFWMPFTGGYGLHDAGWRSEFGGDIYLTDGSHGCVNLPYDAARTLIQNSRSGETRVVIYGGEGSQPAKEQSFKGATEYSVADDAEPFKLKVSSRYAWPDYYYECDNPNVATVDENGLVTVHSIGTANITVTCTTEGYFASATTTVTVEVHSPCDEDRHTLGEPVVTTVPTCQPGIETTSCTRCDYYEDEELDPVAEHTPGQWTTVQEPACEEEGKQVILCTACSEELDDEDIDETGHSYSDGSCSVCGEADPDYIAPTEAAEE